MGLDGFREVHDSPFVVALAQAFCPSLGVGLGAVRDTKRDGLSEVVNGFVCLALLPVCFASEHEGDAVPGIESDGFGKV